MEPFSSAWCPPWVEFGGSSPVGFARGKGRLFGQPQSPSFPCWTGTEGSPFDEQEDLSSLADSTRCWLYHWLCMYREVSGVLGHPQLLCLLHAPDVLETTSASPSPSSPDVFFSFIFWGTDSWHVQGVTPGCAWVNEMDFATSMTLVAPANLLVTQAGTNPQQMLYVRHRYFLGCTWSSELAKLPTLHAHASSGPAAEPTCAPVPPSQRRQEVCLKGAQPFPGEIAACFPSSTLPGCCWGIPALVSVGSPVILCCKRAGGLRGKVNLSYTLTSAGSLWNINVSVKVRILILSAVQVCCL